MKKRFFFFLSGVTLLLAGYGAWKIFMSPVQNSKEEIFYIKTGETLPAVKQKLLEQKIIRPGDWYDIISGMLKYKNPKAGRYKISSGMSIYKLVKILRSGNQSPVNLTITKIRTKEIFAARITDKFEFDSLQMIRFLNNADTLKTYGLDSNTVMAVVIPNTYSYLWNSTPKKVFQKLFDEYQKFWNDERKLKAAKLGLTPLQVSTLASIIDEETNYSPEKQTIASVYLNRLALKMPLQADPTLKFALRNFAAKRVYNSFMEAESPYNTYKYAGLPPGPICTPQAETLDAVLNASKTDYLYFVAKSDFSGSHVFTTNYSDHLKFAREFHNAMDRQDSIRKANK